MTQEDHGRFIGDGECRKVARVRSGCFENEAELFPEAEERLEKSFELRTAKDIRARAK